MTDLIASLIQADSSGRLMCSPFLINRIVKGALKSPQSIPEDIRSAVKYGIKSSDLTHALAALTCLHAIAVNSTISMRACIAGERWMPRIEKLLAKPIHPAFGLALGQTLVDWVFLLGMGDELGSRAANLLLSSPKHRHLLDLLPAPLGHPKHSTQMSLIYLRHPKEMMGPSREAILTFEEMQTLNLPPSMGLKKVPDLLFMFGSSFNSQLIAKIETMGYEELGRLATSRQVQLVADSNALSTFYPLVPAAGTMPLRPTLPSLEQPGGKDKVLSTVVSAMLSNANNLESCSSSLQAIKSSNRANSSTETTKSSLLDCGYISASQCSEWKSRVPIAIELAGGDERSVSQLMVAADIVNAALQSWQQLAIEAIGGETAATPLLPPFHRASKQKSMGKGSDLLGLDELVISNKQGGGTGVGGTSGGGTGATSSSGNIEFPISSPSLVSPPSSHQHLLGSQPSTSVDCVHGSSSSGVARGHGSSSSGSILPQAPPPGAREMEDFDHALALLLNSAGTHSYCPQCQSPVTCLSQEAAHQLRHVVLRMVEAHRAEISSIKAAAVKKFKEISNSVASPDGSLL